MMRIVAALVLAAVLALPWITPAPAAAGIGGFGCPPNYGLVPVESFQNSPFYGQAQARDRNDDGWVCFRFGPPGPLFVDNTEAP